MTSLSIIIPTYNEAANIEPLVAEVFAVLRDVDIDAEMVFVDDNSPDGTADAVRSLEDEWPVRVIVRMKETGLGSAVRRGFSETTRPYVLVMDADMSHDPAIIPSMIAALAKHDVVVGSRFLPGSAVEQWRVGRRALSYTGVALARLLTGVRDPLSGFFAFRRAIIADTVLTTVGYKILLEVLVKASYTRVKELPFTFRARHASTSKLNLVEYARFLRQCLTLLWWRLRAR